MIETLPIDSANYIETRGRDRHGIDLKKANAELLNYYGVPKENIYTTAYATSEHLELFFSYRLEKGQTGRMLAFIGRTVNKEEICLRVKDNLQQISTQINDKSEKNNFSTKPNVIAVTKYVTIERAKEAYEAGIRHFGENRLEGFQKKEALPSDAVIHFIGSLQSRKVKDVINDVDYFHALDRLSLAKEINKRAEHKIKCFLQVNVWEKLLNMVLL